ncbi:MAG: hypothetical protein ABL860_00895 [Candidatus Nitrotoga sp.]
MHTPGHGVNQLDLTIATVGNVVQIPSDHPVRDSLIHATIGNNADIGIK